MAKEDYTAALQALAMLTDTATSFKKMEFASDEAERAFNRQQEASELQFKRQAEFQKDTMMLQNSLQLERDSYNRYKTLMDQVVEYGITYNELESPNAQQIFKDMSSNQVREIGEVKSNFEKLQQFNMNLSNKIAAERKVDLQKARTLQDIELEGKRQVIIESKSKIKSTDRITLNEYLKEGRYLLTGHTYTADVNEKGEITKSADAKLLQAYDESPGSYDGLRIHQEYKSMSGTELASIAENANLDYVTEATGEADYSDVGGWKVAAKEDAKEYAEQHVGYQWIGLNQDDLDSADSDAPTDSWKRFEDNYVNAVMSGIKANPNYRLTDKDSIYTRNLTRKAAVQQAHPDEVKSLNTATQNLKSYIGSVDSSGSINYNLDKKHIKKAAAKMKVTEEQLKSLLSQVMVMPDDPKRAIDLIKNSPSIQQLLSLMPMGKNYIKYLTDLSNKLDDASGQAKPSYIMNKGDEIGRMW
jgi:hypothetical protein